MKLLIVTNSYSGGGAEMISRQHIELMSGVDSIQELSVAGVGQSCDLQLSDASYKPLSSLFCVANFSKLFRYLLKKKPTIVHFHNYMPSLSPSVMLAVGLYKWLFGAKVFQTVHDFHITCPNSSHFCESSKKVCQDCVYGRRRKLQVVIKRCYRNSFWGSLYKFFRHFIAIRLFRAKRIVDFYICPSNFIRNILDTDGIDGNKLVVVKNPIRMAAPSDRLSFNVSKYSSTSFGINILFLGRLSEEKNIEKIISAVSLVRRNGIDARLNICGEGRTADSLKSLCKRLNLVDDVIFHGFCDISRIRKIASDCHIGILASRVYENAPLVLWEYLGLGLLPVCSNIGGMKEFATDFPNALTFDPDNEISIYEAITEARLRLNDSAWVEHFLNSITSVLDERYRQSRDYTHELLCLYEKNIGRNS